LVLLRKARGPGVKVRPQLRHLLREETKPAVLVVLGHFVFVDVILIWTETAGSGVF